MMDLFTDPEHTNLNLLPKDGIVHYLGPMMDRETADGFFQKLLHTIPWERDVLVMFGKRLETKRKVAWYGDFPFDYTYSNTTKTALPWSPELMELKALVETAADEKFNSCLLNLYHSGEEGMSWHSDDEKELKKNGTIASVSFGSTRKFVFKHKNTKEKVEVLLHHGSLLLMTGVTQTHWLHRLPPTKLVKGPRINLTFRTIQE